MATNNADNFVNPLAVGTGGLGVATLTAYTPLCGGTTSTGAVQQATTGFSTSSSVLTSQGASALPQWVSPATSNFTLLVTNTLSSVTTTTFTSTYITSAYSSYYIKYSHLTGPISNFMTFLISTNNGSSYLSTGYQSGKLQYTYNSATGGDANSTVEGIFSPNFGGTAPVMGGYLYLYFPQSGSPSWVGVGGTIGTTGNSDMAYIFGNNSTTTAINNIQITSAGSSNTSGTISLYGISQ